jgi:endogenous inhibitor of DNA gyrase (YacG/DUF329 family)
MNDSKPSTPSDSSNVRRVNCPTCRKVVAWTESEQYRPFCSRKCQLIDFGEWAAERHAIAADTPPDADADADAED